MYLMLIVIGVIVAVIVLLVIRTLLFIPSRDKTVEKSIYNINLDDLSDHLVSMVRCKTVSSYDKTLTSIDEFDKFRNLLIKLYPKTHQNATLESIGQTGLLYRVKGKDSSKSIVLMSHYDVVPAAEEYWEKPPFEGIVENNTIWGRGTLDTKGTLCGIMEAVEILISEGFTPQYDIYLAFSGDEEIAGNTAPTMVDELKGRGVSPYMVVDEGGAVVEGIFPGVAVPTALIGTAEKGMLDLRLKVKSKGGHASSPPVHTPIGVLAKAVTRIENKPFKFILTPPVKSLFSALGRHSSFIYRMVFANLWFFSPILDLLCRKSGGELNAMMRTTCAFTMMQGSDATNVIPPVASVGANLRIIGGQTYESIVDQIKKITKTDEIEYDIIYGMNPSPSSSIEGPGYEILSDAIAQTWSNALISPYLMFACSDSRHYHNISDYVYRFSAMHLTSEQRALIHSHNERITIDQLEKIVEFYLNLIKKC